MMLNDDASPPPKNGGAARETEGYSNPVDPSLSRPFRFKARPEDFIVEELPLDVEEPDPSGTHVWFEMEKRGISTPDATRRLARALNRQPQEIAFAGRKDAVAVTRQRMSIEHVSIDELLSLSLDGIQIRNPYRCRKKLRVGQLAGNRFHLRLTGVEEETRDRLADELASLQRTGVPNAYGDQRFGRGGGGMALGRALVKGTPMEYLQCLADECARGPQTEAAHELLRRIREGNPSELRRATELVRSLTDDLRAVARTLARRRPDDLGELVRAVPQRSRSFHLAILQAKMFNEVLERRVADETFATPLVGDIVRAANGRHSELMELPAPITGPSDGPSEASGETIVTGPIWAADMKAATGVPGEIERAALEAEGLTPADLANPGGLRPRGARRPLTAALGGALTEEWRDEAVWIAFDLPVGSYATVVLDELARRVSGRD
ncbi:tRNA pseudouridine synthase D [Planctomycetes bacterium Poly30]|uniref:tRNA pseudouridine synthase D n=2 Tax=Saltatorellus ferox TaxID=2528018 RepID=A0A518ERS9_9BACT|nr:tRNA pseudouridine synthase D [Planctomycetes bacterium Poly30]